MNTKNIGRNDPCHCGSGKKFKQCCQNKEVINNEVARNTLRESVPELFKKALKLEIAHEFQQAIELYKEILEIAPKHVDSLNNLGVMYYKTDKLELAKSVLYKAVKLEPSTTHYHNLAQVLTENEAIECLKKAIQLNPGSAMLYNSLGAVFFKHNQTSDALLCYKKAIYLNHSYTPALNNLATTLMGHNNYS